MGHNPENYRSSEKLSVYHPTFSENVYRRFALKSIGDEPVVLVAAEAMIDAATEDLRRLINSEHHNLSDQEKRRMEIDAGFIVFGHILLALEEIERTGMYDSFQMNFCLAEAGGSADVPFFRRARGFENNFDTVVVEPELVEVIRKRAREDSSYTIHFIDYSNTMPAGLSRYMTEYPEFGAETLPFIILPFYQAFMKDIADSQENITQFGKTG